MYMILRFFWGFGIYDGRLWGFRGIFGVKMVVWVGWVRMIWGDFDGFFVVFLSF